MPDRCAACAEPLLPAAALCVACGEFADGAPPHPSAPSPDAPASQTQAPTLPARTVERGGSAPVESQVPLTPSLSKGERNAIPVPAHLPTDLAPYRARLRDTFGYPDFRGGQARALEAIAEGDVLAVMPTGSGKSLCYVLPALEVGRTVVVSPLIALMQDQVEGLQAAGVAATFINSNLSRDEQNERYRTFLDGRIDLLYVAPERFANAAFTRGLRAAGVNLLAIDEAHCISEWGHNFRPDYLQLGAVRRALDARRTLALTATANPQVRRDIVARLGFADSATEVVTSVDRPNLAFSAHGIPSEPARAGWLESFIRRRPRASGIVYARTRKTTEALADALCDAGIRAAAYHAGMAKDDRSRVQRAFTLGDLPVIVATNAFGMGIDKPDVRYVVHYNLPGRLEAYYQEAGRAGRDGEPAECVLLHGPRDRSLQQFFIRQAHPTPDQVRDLWEQWLGILDHDGRIPLPAMEHDAGAPMAVAALRASGLVEDVELRVRSRDPRAPINPSVIAAHRRHAEDRLAEMVAYAETRDCRRNLILRYFGESPAIPCGGCDNCRRPAGTDAADPVEPELATGHERAAGRHAHERSSRAGRRRERTTPSARPPDRALLEALREWRRTRARTDKIPAYTIAPDRTLEEIASTLPTTSAALHHVWGLGAARVDRFGEEILDLVDRHRR